MSELIPLLDNRVPSSDREVYLPSRGGGFAKAPPKKPPPKAVTDYYEDLKAQARGRNEPPAPEGGYEPGPYGHPRGSGEATFGPREAPTENYNLPRYHGMSGEHFTIRQGPDGGYYCLLHNPEADPVGPFPTAEAAADYFAPRGNQ